MSSTRLPGKVLLPVLGKPLLAYQIERLRQVKEADEIVILTTTNKADDQIVTFCEAQNVLFFRGDEEDVLARYYHAALERRPDAIVRITSDCPLIDPEIVDQVIRAFRYAKPPVDYISNTLQLTFPRGLDVEIFSFKALQEAFLKAREAYEREHVTVYLYRHPKQFKLQNISSPIPLAHHRWTVDTLEDFQLIKLILEALYQTQPYFRLQEVIALLQKHPEWGQINAHIQQKKMPL